MQIVFCVQFRVVSCLFISSLCRLSLMSFHRWPARRGLFRFW